MQYNNQQQRGFTLIEMFVAILIFSLTLTAFLLVTTRGIRSSRDASNEVIAQFLAQEGIELIEAKRDYNFINSTTIGDWLYGINDVFTTGSQICEGSSGCYVRAFQDVADPNYIEECASECPPLEIDSDGRYGYDLVGGQETSFIRTIRVRSFSGGYAPGYDASRVTSTVEWQTPDGATRSVTLEKSITNWFNLIADIEFEP